MPLPAFCFLTAAVTGLTGISLGIYMGIAEDHTLMPVHAHLNLIGWVSLFLFGLYYRAHPETVGALARVQVASITIGYTVMLGALAAMRLSGAETALPAVILGSLLVWLGMACFVAVVWRECVRTATDGALRRTGAAS